MLLSGARTIVLIFGSWGGLPSGLGCNQLATRMTGDLIAGIVASA